MRKTTITASLSIILLSAAGTASLAAHDDNPAAKNMTTMDGMAAMDGMPEMEGMSKKDGMATMEGMAGKEGMAPMDGMSGMKGMAAGGDAMPMKGMGMMPMTMGMMEMMPMMQMGKQPMAGMAATTAAPQAIPPGLEKKLDLLINSIDSLTARIEKLEAPAAN